MSKDKGLCEICGCGTSYSGTKRCNGCWEMERGLSSLISKDKEKAIKWLEYHLEILKRK